MLSADQIAKMYVNTLGGPFGMLPPVTPVQLASGAVLDLYGFPQTVASLSGVGSGGGTVTNGSSLPATLILATSGSTTFSGAISNGTGTVALVMNGTGTQVLTGSNSYTGGTTVNGGLLQFNANTAVPGSGTITINSGGAVALAQTGTYSTVTGWLTSGRIAPASAGALALIANSSETISMTSSYANLSLGAAARHLQRHAHAQRHHL